MEQFIKKIKLENLLSFSAPSCEIPLGNLNVLIGPNGSGKSNIIEAISLLQASPKELTEPIRRGGGIRDWLWKGASEIPVAEIEIVVNPLVAGTQNFRYKLAFTSIGQRFELADECLENEYPVQGQLEPNSVRYSFCQH
ncbi:MAG: hypothetical protein BA863_01340 [Desulfovibrio sp. S3730MH75]|nr:MAG: hypothetical protein BA863_01340 [Desulfovibrio sp. S3730MH75]